MRKIGTLILIFIATASGLSALLFARLEPIAHSYVYEGSIDRCSVDNYLEEHPAPCDVAV